MADRPRAHHGDFEDRISWKRASQLASYYLNIYLTDFTELRTWFWTGPSSGEQESFSSLFIRGLGRLSRNEQPHQAFKEINLAYDYLKRLVEWDHPLV